MLTDFKQLMVLAFDYDGTLTHDGTVSPEVRGALGRAREAGLRTVLVTGRRLADWRRKYGDVEPLFDRVVGENGAVLSLAGGGILPLAAPVDPALDAALAAEGVPTFRGEVIVAMEARFEEVVRRQVARLGADVRLERNRSALMVLPAAVTKATGLSHALAALGVGLEQTAAFGDAENDVAMFRAVGLGVAVGNALPELRQVADRVLEEPNGVGIVRFIDELLRERAV